MQLCEPRWPQSLIPLIAPMRRHGLAHVAFKFGSSPEALRLARTVLGTERTPVLYEAERSFTRSLHVLDPDGDEIELYIDVSDT